MKKVRLLVSTAYQGSRKEGDEISVPEDFADRWAKNGIAELIVEEVKELDEDEKGSLEPTDKSDITNLSAKALYALCKEMELDVEAKQPKEYYLEKLTPVQE